jgi:hypothetical protein
LTATRKSGDIRLDMRPWTALIVLVLLAGGAAAERNAAEAFRQTGRATAPARPAVPPLSMTCPMHPDVIESRPGSCPLCKMALVPVRLDSAWMCPVHTTVMDEREGTCRICRRPLIQARVAVTWTCLGQPGIDRLEPGTCADGSAMVRRRTLRPHGNHNPQHGGQFFMAPNNWHHLEGTYPRDRVFRLYIYDDYARSLSPADMKRVQARVVTRETFDPATRKTTELASFPLRVSRDGAYLEARIDAARLPAEMTAKVKIKPDAPEYRFDFTFPALTKEPALAPAPTRGPSTADAAPVGARASAPVRPTAAAARGSEAVSSPAEATPGNQADAALAPLQIPETIPAIVEQLQQRERYIREFIQQGNFGAVWVPAFHAKDLAVALEPHLAHLSPPARGRAEPALQRVVRVAWLLDAFGDVGNRQQLESGHAEFAAAVDDVVKAFAEVK